MKSSTTSATSVGDQRARSATRGGGEVRHRNLRAECARVPDSFDSQDDLADAYLADEQKELARQHAEKGVALLDAGAPASSWSNTAPRRAEVRRDLEQVLQKVNAAR